MCLSQRIKQKQFHHKIALAFVGSIFLSACGVEESPNSIDQTTPTLGAANTRALMRTTEGFTGELLSDGSIRLKWPQDPLAISYLIMSKGKLAASVPASVLSAVVEAKGKSAANGKFAIESVNASNVRSEWVSNPVISIAVEETPPIGEALPEDETPPIEEMPPVEETSPIEETPPVEETSPIEETPPVEETPPIEETPPAEETPPIEETPPAEEIPPVEETPPVETVNLPPDITDTSYNCDPVIESVAFTVGQTDHFTLSVTDESPLTLTYSFDSSIEGVVSVEVDGNGVFTISALQAGDTYLWLSAEDEKGLVDEYELRVVVQ